MNILYHHRTQREGVEGVHIRGVIDALRGLGNDINEIALVNGNMVSDTNKNPLNNDKKIFAQIARRCPNKIFRLLELFYNGIAIAKLGIALCQNKYDIIYERYAYFNFAGIVASIMFRIPIIVEINITTEMQDARQIELCWLARKIEQFVLHKASAIIVVSKALRESLINRGICGDRIYIQPNACDEEIIGDRCRLQERSSNIIRIGFMGRLLAWYKIDMLIDIFARIHSDYQNTELVLIGDGVQREQLLHNVHKYHLEEDVKFLGSTTHERALELLETLDIGVIPSSNTWGSPMKLFEYMGKGLPVVAPDLDVITSIMKNGEHGIVFRYDDPNGLEAAIRELVCDKEKREQMGRNGQEYIRENHTWAKVGKNIMDIAEKLYAQS